MKLLVLAILTNMITGCVVVGAEIFTKDTSTIVVPSFLTSNTELRKFCPSTTIGVVKEMIYP
jgi:hypothetical protein